MTDLDKLKAKRDAAYNAYNAAYNAALAAYDARAALEARHRGRVEGTRVGPAAVPQGGCSVTANLEPCPFCANDGSGPVEHALHISHNEHDWRAPSWSPQCDKCTATMGYFDSEEEATDAWNTRDAYNAALAAQAKGPDA